MAAGELLGLTSLKVILAALDLIDLKVKLGRLSHQLAAAVFLPQSRQGMAAGF